MNLLYLCDEYPPCKHGGIGSVTQILAREMKKKGHQVSICGLYPYYRAAEPYEEDQGVRVNRIFYGNKHLLRLSKHHYFGKIFNIRKYFEEYVRYLADYIVKNRIDLIEMPDFNEVFWYSGPIFIRFPDFGIPLVVKLHGSYSFVNRITGELPFNKSLYIKEKHLVHRATGILAISYSGMTAAKKIFMYDKEIKVINNGIPINNEIRYTADNDSKSVIFAGTLSKQKGILSLIKAWEIVIKEIPSAKLFLYGKGGQKNIAIINNLISDKRLKSIEIMGFIDRNYLPFIYSKASCAVFPSYIESFSMAPLESMQVGCPTIYTKRTSGKELITSGTDGLLIDPDNTEELADAIIFMLTNREAAIKIGESGARKVRNNYDIAHIGDEHIKYYSDLINNWTNKK